MNSDDVLEGREESILGNQGGLGFWSACLYSGGAVGAFHLAFHWDALALLMIFYFMAMAMLTGLPSSRKAFYFGLAIGFCVFAPSLLFLWTIFKIAAIPLWLVLSFWHGLFLSVIHKTRERFGWKTALCLLPLVWMGTEFFRSELYYLRFSWLSAGFAFSDSELYSPLRFLGVYGLGLVMAGLGCWLLASGRRRVLVGSGVVATMAFLLLVKPWLVERRPADPGRLLQVAGVQLEFPMETAVLQGLNLTRKKAPDAELLVLSEYTFLGKIPESVRDWCQREKVHLIAGGKEYVEGKGFYNMAYVVGPEGEIVFKQAKSVPIQFFDDGLPAPEQKLWDSPWGKLGIAICYDLSYRQVMDRFVEQGAEDLIIPTMDVEEWGREEHELHARVAPMRTMEYGIPILRLASSGISQLVIPTGVVTASAPFPGSLKVIQGEMELKGAGVIPWDWFLAPVATSVTGSLLIFLLVEPVYLKIRRRRLGREGRMDRVVYLGARSRPPLSWRRAVRSGP